MLLNDCLANRSPSLRVLANGTALTGGCEAEISSNNHFGADHFSALIALGPDAAADAYFWSSATGIVIDIQFSLDGGDSFTSLIQGLADNVVIDPVNGTVTVEGRDFSAALIEAQTQETFSNQTSSEITTLFAQRRGLTPNVIETTTPVGRFYESDHVGLTLSRFSGTTTEWDLLVYLARQEGYDLFVTGGVLNFQPVSDLLSVSQTLYISNLISARMQRVMTLARDVQVTVKSWSSAQQTAFSQSVTSSLSTDISAGTTNPASYFVVVPNLTSDKARSLAQRHLSELTRHERIIDISMPGETALTPRSVVQIEGTGTAFDQAYYVDSIERSFRLKTGFVQHIRACSSSPRNQTSAAS